MADEQTVPPVSDKTEIFRMPAADSTVPDMIAGDRPSCPTLTIVKGPSTGQTFMLDENEISLGRDPQNSVFLNDMTVSRHHAKITLNPDDETIATIEDCRSLNGTWVDGAIVHSAILSDGSTVQIGTFRMVFHTQHKPSRLKTDIS
ncbi:MAG: FHA domain-containing protein [Atopobiaceae bacterium]|nr:FHA domain-containing protein [Atopobiaceae bacterium]